MTSRIRRWRGVKPCSSAGPSGRELTDAVSPNWAATSAALGRPRFRFGTVEWRLKSSWSLMNHTLEKGDQRIKHLFEVCRVGENCRYRVVKSLSLAQTIELLLECPWRAINSAIQIQQRFYRTPVR